MSSIKKIFLTFIFAFAFIIIGTITSNASSDLYLRDLKFDVKINNDGSMDVRETWDIDIDSTNTLFKTFKMDSKKFSSIKNVKVVETTKGKYTPFKNINKEMYHVTKDCYYGLINKSGDFEIAWGIGMDHSAGKRKYEISYTVEDAISKISDGYELYWQFVGSGFKIDAKKITGTITLPQSATNKEDIKVWGHTEDLNGEIYVVTNKIIQFNINQFKHGVYVEVRAVLPSYFSIQTNRTSSNSLEKIIEEERVWVEEANRKREMKQKIKNTLGIGAIVVASIIGFFIAKNIKNNIKLIKTLKKIKPTQELQYYRDIPDESISPGESIILQKQLYMDFGSTDIGNVFSAILLQLSLKNEIEFEIIDGGKKKDNIFLKLKGGVVLEQADEKAVYMFLAEAIKDEDKISFKELEKYIKKHSSKVISLKKKLDKAAKTGIKNRGYVDLENKKQYDKKQGSIALYALGTFYGFIGCMVGFILNTYAFIAAIIFFIIMLLGAIVNAKAAHRINIFTQPGVDESEKWKAFKKFLTDFSTMDRKEIPEIVIWEKYLVYATAFGMTKEVINKLKMIYPEIEANPDFNTGVYMGIMIHTDFGSSMSRSVSSAMASTYSSAGGGGRRIFWWRRPVAGGGGGGGRTLKGGNNER